MKRYPDHEHLFYSQSFLLMKVLKKEGGLPTVLSFLKDRADVPALLHYFDLTASQLKDRYFREIRRSARGK